MLVDVLAVVETGGLAPAVGHADRPARDFAVLVARDDKFGRSGGGGGALAFAFSALAFALSALAFAFVLALCFPPLTVFEGSTAAARAAFCVMMDSAIVIASETGSRDASMLIDARAAM